MADNNGDGFDDVTGLPVGPGAPGGDFGQNPTFDLPPGWVINPTTGRLIPPGTGPTGGPGIAPYTPFLLPGSSTYVYFNGNSLVQAPKWMLQSVGIVPGGSGPSGSGPGGGGSLQDDPRYWDLQYQELYQRGINMGLDAEAARQQALATLIANRNNTAVDVARTSADVAAEAARFAANPRDAVAELMYRNQVGGSVPFGDMTNDNFGAYGKALAEKAASIFSPVQQDIQQARLYRDAIPPVDFFGAETRGELGLPPTPAQRLTGAGMPAAAPAAPVNGLQMLVDRLNSFSQQKKDDFVKFVTAASGGVQPPNAEDGINMNIMEPAMVIGRSGRIYATLAEEDPEELLVKPLASVKERKKKEKEANKSFMQATSGATRMQTGGTVSATPDDFMEQLRQYLGSLGGGGGGTGAFDTPLPSLRLLAGAPANALADDPVAQDYALAGYSALGIDPRTVASTIKRYSPSSPINNLPRVSFI